jgi:hypothetical protein
VLPVELEPTLILQFAVFDSRHCGDFSGCEKWFEGRSAGEQVLLFFTDVMKRYSCVDSAVRSRMGSKLSLSPRYP